MGEVELINIKNQTHYFYNHKTNIKTFELNLLKINRNYIKALVFTTLNILQLKKLMIKKIFTA